jgi:hypothetical protein
MNYLIGFVTGITLTVFAFGDAFSTRRHFLDWEHHYRYGNCLTFWRVEYGHPSTTRYGTQLFCI